ncbi:MAG: S8 family serine peptidase, partial [Planctomycetota bacterium]
MSRQRRSLLSGVLLCSWGFLFAPGAVEADSAPPASTKLHPALVRLLGQTTAPVKAWVFFADKGIGSQQEYDRAIQQVASTYNARAVQRRMLRGQNARRGGGVFDEHDLPVVPAYIDAVVATGARLHVTSRWVNAVSVYATRQQLEAIAGLPCVTRLQPVARAARVSRPVSNEAMDEPLPAPAGGDPQRSVNYGASQAQLAQINLIALHDEGYTGGDVIVGILDTGFRRTHEAFNEPGHVVNVIAEYDFVDDDNNAAPETGDPSSQHNHGTMILGCLGSYKPGELVGGAFDASFILAKTEDTTAEYPAEEDNYVAGLEFIESNGGDMMTSSLGYIDWYTQGDLDGETAVTTIAVNVATSLGVHCCTAAGNEFHDTNPTTSHLIAPSDAFQVIACGAVNSSGTIASFSSDGPSADGRVKPEVLARGVSTHTVSPSSNTSYTTADGTSLSTPLVACAVACLIQANPQWTVDQMRDHLFFTADDYVANGTFDPLYIRGYGVINAFAAYADCNINEIPDECDVDCGTPGGACDVPGCGGSLDCNTNGIPDECEIDCNSNGIPDDCDIADCPAGDTSCADCDANGVPDGCDVPFPQQGRISLDRNRYACEATATIQVDDCGLNADDNVVETVQITIDSDSEPGGETVLLTETGPATGAFTGTIPLSMTDGSGILLVADGETVTAEYVDADDGLGGTNVVVTTTAVVDCEAPVISNVQTINIEPRSATLTFGTDEPAYGTVRYGTSCASLTETVAGTSLNTMHSLDLAGLTDATTYFYAVDAE